MGQHSKFEMNISTIFIILMLVSYFLPWGTFLGQNLTAMQMPDVAARVNVLSKTEDSILSYSYIFYLPFIFTLITIITDIFFNKLQFIPLLFLFIALVVCSFYFILICNGVWEVAGKPNGGSKQYLSFGFYFAWITFLISFLVELTTAFIIPKLKKQKI